MPQTPDGFLPTMPSPPMQAAIDVFLSMRDKKPSGPPPTIEVMREKFAPGGKPFPIPSDVEVIPEEKGPPLGSWLVTPGARRDRTILFLHGGGFTLGDVKSHGELVSRIGRAANARVFFLDYRMAPEDPFPAALEDVKACWRWLRDDQKLDARTLAVAGDSAGGGLTLSLVDALRDAKEPLPASIALLSPAIDLSLSGESVTANEGRDVIFTADRIRAINAGYLKGADPKDPRA